MVGKRHPPAGYVGLALILTLMGVLATGWSGAPRTEELQGGCYLPFAARPISTLTPTPTATPLPPIADVRVEGSCSNFRGGSAADPNGEYVCFRNYGPRAVEMTNWRVEDAGGHSYSFPTFTLQVGAIVVLYSGPGADTASELHWARGLVWNNDHDTVYVFDAFGRLVSRYVY